MCDKKPSLFVFGLFTLVLTVLFADAAFAAASTVGVNEVAENIVTSSARLPGLVTGICYLLALLFGVTGILKLKDHVDSRASSSGNAVPLRTPIIRFLAGGALLALPMILEAASRTIGDPTVAFGWSSTSGMNNMTNHLQSIITTATASGPTGNGINQVMMNIVRLMSDLPGIVTAMAYLIGLVACVVGVLKIKEHVESPERTELKEGVIRLLIGGAMFSLPTIYFAVRNTIMGTDGSYLDAITRITPTAATYLHSAYASDTAQSCTNIIASNGDGLGASICQFVGSTGATPAFLTALCYLFGIVIGLWALLKIRDHVLNPQQTPVWEGVSRLIVAGAFLSLPYIAGVFSSTVADRNAFTSAGTNAHTGWIAVDCSVTPRPLDTAMACFMQDVMAPAHVLFGHFAFIAGLVFIMIGITRLMKSAQEGARGPGGRGTIATFLIAGILLSYNVILEFFTSSISRSGSTQTNTTLTYTTGMTADEVEHANIVVQTVLQFMIIVGLISFIRGWFIIRDVAEGNQQASLMAGATHIIGGALAINLGPILNAVQATLGIAGVGLTFS